MTFYNRIVALANKFVKISYTPPNGSGILFTCSEDNTALLLLRSRTVKEPNTWGVPGGGLKFDETFEQAAKRECLEELGVLPQKGVIVNTIINKQGNWVYKIFVIDISFAEKKSWTKYIRLNEEHNNYKWFKINNLPENLHSPIKILL